MTIADIEAIINAKGVTRVKVIRALTSVTGLKEAYNLSQKSDNEIRSLLTPFLTKTSITCTHCNGLGRIVVE